MTNYFKRRKEDGTEDYLGPATIVLFLGSVAVVAFFFFRSASPVQENRTEVAGGGVSMDQTVRSSKSYEEVNVQTPGGGAGGLGSLRGLDILERSEIEQEDPYENQIIDSINTDLARLYNNDDLGDPRFGDSDGIFSNDADYLNSLLNLKGSGIELNDRLTELLFAAGYEKLDEGLYESQTGRQIFPTDYKSIESLIEDIGFKRFARGKYRNEIGVILDFEKANFKGGTAVEGLYFINAASGELKAKSVIQTDLEGLFRTPDGIDLYVDRDGTIYTSNRELFTNIESEGEFVVPDGRRYSIKKTSLAITLPINPNDEELSSEPVVLYGASMFDSKDEVLAEPNGYEIGKYLPRGYKIPVVLITPFRTDVQAPMIVFAAYRDIYAFGKKQIPKGTRFIAQAESDDEEKVASPPGDRVRFEVNSILYPDGSETPIDGLILDRDKMVGLKGFYIPLPVYVQAYPLFSELAVSLFERLGDNDSDTQSLVLTNTDGGFALAGTEEPTSGVDASIAASMSAIRQFSNRYSNELYDRNRPHVRVPTGHAAIIQVLSNTDLTEREIPFSNAGFEEQDTSEQIVEELLNQALIQGVNLSSSELGPPRRNLAGGIGENPTDNLTDAEQSFFSN